MKRIISMALILALLCGVLSACSTLEDGDKGAIIDVYFTDELYNFDPALSYTDDSMVKITALLFEGLTYLDDNGNWKKAIMDKYTYTTDEEKGEYKLLIDLKSTKWSDGRTVQAADFVYAWKRIIDPEFRGDASSLLYDIRNARKVKFGDASIDDFGASAVDTYTLQVLFEHDIDTDAFFKTVASPALVPQREDTVASNSEYWARKTSTILTNGPFALKQIDYGHTLRIERNSYYFRDTDKPDALDKYVIPWRIVTHYDYGDINAQFDAYMNSSIWYLGTIPLAQREAVKKQAVISDELATHTYYFNVKNDLFKDARVRRALSMAIDREQIVSIVTYAKAATGLIPYGVSDANGKKDFREVADSESKLISTAADMDGAKALLREAGVSGGSFDLTVKDNEQDKAVAEAVARVWKDLGFNVKVKALKGSRIGGSNDAISNLYEDKFNDAYSKGDFDVIAVDMNMLTTDAFGALSVFADDFSGGGVDLRSENYDVKGHITGYSNSEYNDLIERAYAATDSSERTALLHQAEQMLAEDMPVIPLIYLQDAYLINKKVLSGYKDGFNGTRDFTRMKMKNYMAYKEAILAAEQKEAEETASALK